MFKEADRDGKQMRAGSTVRREGLLPITRAGSNSVTNKEEMIWAV